MRKPSIIRLAFIAHLAIAERRALGEIGRAVRSEGSKAGRPREE